MMTREEALVDLAKQNLMRTIDLAANNIDGILDIIEAEHELEVAQQNIGSVAK